MSLVIDTGADTGLQVAGESSTRYRVDLVHHRSHLKRRYQRPGNHCVRFSFEVELLYSVL